MTEAGLMLTAPAFGGASIGRLEDGRVCFVRNAFPGEKVRVRLVREKKNFTEGELLEVCNASKERITPECPYYPACPGCSYLSVTYEEELRLKAEIFSSFLLHSRLTAPDKLLPPFRVKKRFGWRNKLKLAVEQGRCGYRGHDNRTLLPVKQCLLGHAEINRHLAENTPPQSDEWLLRRTEKDHVVTSASPESAGLLCETLPGFGDFEVPFDGFFQTNPPVAAELVRRTAEVLKDSGAKELLELYCGVGVFSIAAAETIPALHGCGVELDRRAIASARRNAAQHHTGRQLEFFAADAAKFRPRQKPDAVLADPPRGGLSPALLQKLCAMRPGLMIYISCSPDTLTRDLHQLCASGAEIVSSGMFDMFPGTAHFESMTVLRWQ